MSTEVEYERQISLMKALDAIRDALDDDDDPQPMFSAITRLLKNTFEADACAIMLISETSDEAESIASIGVPDDTALMLCRKAMQNEKPGILETRAWPYAVGAQVVLSGPHPLGGLFVARGSRPFDEPDLALLELAEIQIDSAIIQARMVWKLAQRNRELEAIYQIDRLRDDAGDESDLINSFTNVLLEHFDAILCMVILSHVDSGEQVLRSVVDRQELSAAALDAIRELTEDIRIPQVIPTLVDISGGLTLLAAPFVVGGERLGAVVVGRKRAFSVGDHRLMFAMMSQMDSAVVHIRIAQQLTRRNSELEIIYLIDQIRDREQDFDAMLQAVLAELCRAISSEMGYLMLYSAKEEAQLQLMAETKGGQLASPDYLSVISRYSREALNRAELVFSNAPDGPMRSIAAVPLILNDRIIGVFGAVNSANAHGFSVEDRRMIKAITSQVDTAVFERLEQRRMRRVLSRSVDPQVLEALLQTADAHVLAGERVELSVLYADLRGSTEWAERTDPEEFVSILNIFLSEMTEVVFKYGGTLDKFVGDEIIGLFGTPVRMEDHVYRAAAAALEMQAVHTRLQADLRSQGRELPALGVGISSGEAIAGEFGPSFRTDFTAMGRVMNLGSRLCGAAKPGQIIISPTTRQELGDLVTANTLEPITPKGISQPIQIYELINIAED